MPARPHALPAPASSRAAAAVLLATVVTGCGSTGQAAAPAPATSLAVLDAAGLLALADKRPPTALPPATGVAERALAALRETHPDAEPVGPYDAAQVADALALAARLVAATRADPDHLCGPPDSSPASALATPALRAWLADPAHQKARVEIETTISASGTTGDCGPLAWVGPGVVPGPQQWSVAPGTDGADLDVTWAGSFGYALADASGVPEPWGMRGSVRYGLRLDGGQWRVSGWHDGARGRVSQGWPHDVPLPEGYLSRPALPAADPDALDGVRDAARAWAAAPASTMTVQQDVDGKDGSQELTAASVAAPGRGDATGDVGGTRTLWLDHGHRVLSKPAPGAGTGPGWIERDATAPAEAGVSAPTSPWAVTALLADADAAAPTDCPQGLAAASCLTAVVATADPSAPLAADVSLAHRAGLPWLVLDVGLDRQGRPVFVRLRQQAMAFGEPYARLTSTASFTGYADRPPPRISEPDPADVAPVTQAQQ